MSDCLSRNFENKIQLNNPKRRLNGEDKVVLRKLVDKCLLWIIRHFIFEENITKSDIERYSEGLEKRHLLQIVEERYLSELCGNVLCWRRIKKKKYGGMKFIVRLNEINNRSKHDELINEMEYKISFCSNDCRQQMDEWKDCLSEESYWTHFTYIWDDPRYSERLKLFLNYAYIYNRHRNGNEVNLTELFPLIKSNDKIWNYFISTNYYYSHTIY
ncbi:hypothetical protein SNEBB_003429 [Seison nebaliae]|nr:hypothetical protein SNEBB_003429 [Seison nebaliae]